LITAAAYLEEKRLLVLLGYTSLLNPFLHLCYDFQGHDFFSGNNRRITVTPTFHQTEGIATANGLDVYVSNEQTPVFLAPPKLFRYDLRYLLEDYLLSLGKQEPYVVSRARLWPSPAGEYITVELGSDRYPVAYEIIDSAARVVQQGTLETDYNILEIAGLKTGGYTFRFLDSALRSIQFIKN
jgi:hypothetical protein